MTPFATYGAQLYQDAKYRFLFNLLVKLTTLLNISTSGILFETVPTYLEGGEDRSTSNNLPQTLRLCLLLFNVLATSRVIPCRILTIDSAIMAP